ncbi:MAG: hypothetical protein M1826_002200 [Phylliscum demangeonii]|nr:MAG: hypothetical protein M1826_002200 [Phylliscum demangeonii]
MPHSSPARAFSPPSCVRRTTTTTTTTATATATTTKKRRADRLPASPDLSPTAVDPSLAGPAARYPSPPMSRSPPLPEPLQSSLDDGRDAPSTTRRPSTLAAGGPASAPETPHAAAASSLPPPPPHEWTTAHPTPASSPYFDSAVGPFPPPVGSGSAHSPSGYLTGPVSSSRASALRSRVPSGAVRAPRRTKAHVASAAWSGFRGTPWAVATTTVERSIAACVAPDRLQPSWRAGMSSMPRRSLGVGCPRIRPVGERKAAEAKRRPPPLITDHSTALMAGPGNGVEAEAGGDVPSCEPSLRKSSCRDVPHKPRGRPRIRAPGEPRHSAAAGEHGPRRPIRPVADSPRPSPTLGPSLGPAASLAGTYRELRPHAEEARSSLGRVPDVGSPRSSFQGSAPFGATTGYSHPTPGPPPVRGLAIALLKMDLSFVKANALFCDALGIGARVTEGGNLRSIVAEHEWANVEQVERAMQQELTERDPAFLPPIFGSPEAESIQQIRDVEIDELTQGAVPRVEHLTFRLPDGRPWTTRVQFRLGKKSVYFVAMMIALDGPSIQDLIESPFAPPRPAAYQPGSAPSPTFRPLAPHSASRSPSWRGHATPGPFMPSTSSSTTSPRPRPSFQPTPFAGTRRSDTVSPGHRPMIGGPLPSSPAPTEPRQLFTTTTAAAAASSSLFSPRRRSEPQLLLRDPHPAYDAPDLQLPPIRSPRQRPWPGPEEAESATARPAKREAGEAEADPNGARPRKKRQGVSVEEIVE